MPPTACPSCGARLTPGAERCDLCGARPQDALRDTAATPEPVAVPPSAEPVAETDAAPAQQFCMACGTTSPAHARFCWKCGAPLAAGAYAPTGAPPPTGPTSAPPVRPQGAPADARPSAAAGQRALVLLGVAAVAVVALFFLSQRTSAPASLVPPGATGAATAEAPPPPPLPPEIAARAADLEDRIAAATEAEERFALRRDLVETLVRAGAFARAGEVQEALARATGDPLAWADAGSFFLAHMLRAEGPEREQYARRSAYAYEQALEQDPSDLDVKTDLATAYLNDPVNPMRAVEVVREVLDANPDHARARFNYGLMLAQIGRSDQAREQFQRVIALTAADDLVHERAQEELERLDVLAPTG